MPKYIAKGPLVIQGKPLKHGEAFELPSEKFIITKSRYLGEQYIAASPDFPAEVSLPEGSLVDREFYPVDAPPLPLKAHYIGGKTSTAPSAAEHFKGKGKRPSDSEPV